MHASFLTFADLSPIHSFPQVFLSAVSWIVCCYLVLDRKARLTMKLVTKDALVLPSDRRYAVAVKISEEKTIEKCRELRARQQPAYDKTYFSGLMGIFQKAWQVFFAKSCYSEGRRFFPHVCTVSFLRRLPWRFLLIHL
jgi:hypothetical protein